MNLYISIDYKDKEGICGCIFNLPPRKKNQESIYLYFYGVRISDTTFELELRKPASDKNYTVILDEKFECKMTGKDILFYVEQRIDNIWKML